MTEWMCEGCGGRRTMRTPVLIQPACQCNCRHCWGRPMVKTDNGFIDCGSFKIRVVETWE